MTAYRVLSTKENQAVRQQRHITAMVEAMDWLDAIYSLMPPALQKQFNHNEIIHWAEVRGLITVQEGQWLRWHTQ